LRRIEQETGVRRETAGTYLKAAGIGVRPPGAWGRRAPAKPAIEVTTGSDAVNPNTNTNPKPENLPDKVKAKAEAKPANADGVITGFGVGLSDSEQKSPQPVPSTSFCEPFRDAIELGLSRDRNAMAIWQDLVSESGFRTWFHGDFRPGDGYGKPGTARLARVESARLWEQCHSEGSRRCSVDLAAIVY